MKSLMIAIGNRIGGERPGGLRAFAGATTAGVTTGVIVYKLLRRELDGAD